MVWKNKNKNETTKIKIKKNGAVPVGKSIEPDIVAPIVDDIVLWPHSLAAPDEVVDDFLELTTVHAVESEWKRELDECTTREELAENTALSKRAMSVVRAAIKATNRAAQKLKTEAHKNLEKTRTMRSRNSYQNSKKK